MSERSLFDYGSGRIVVADGDEILVYDGESEAPLWRERIEGSIHDVAIGDDLVLALGEQGTLRRFDRDGAGRGVEHLEGEARGLCARAALTTTGLHWLTPSGAKSGGAAVSGQCLGAGDGKVAVGTAGGELWVFEDGAASPTTKIACGGPPHSIAWHPERFWLVAVGSKVLRIGDDGQPASFTSAGEHRPRLLCCSADGKHIGLALDDKIALVMEYPSKDTAGNATYGDRVVTGLAFGPAPWFGVGLDKGDGNKFNLRTGATHRTDTHPGRPHNSWVLMAAFGEPEPPPAQARAPLPAPAAGKPGLAVIEEMLRATRKSKRIGGVLMAVLGIPLIFAVLVPSISQEMGTIGAIFIGGLGALSVGLGGFLLMQAHRLRDVRSAPVYRTLVENPERIVWFYEFVMTVNGVPNHSVVLMCSDGTKFDFNLRQADPSPLLTTLRDMLPHAVVGYSPERLALFKKSRDQFAAAVRAAGV